MNGSCWEPECRERYGKEYAERVKIKGYLRSIRKT